MNQAQFRQAYHAARIGQINENNLESVAAVIALEDSRKPDLIGKVYRDGKEFMDFLEARHEKRERLQELKSRRPSKRTKIYFGEFDNLQNDGVFRSRQSAARLPDLLAD